MMTITDLDIERFTTGDCHYLAKALHKLTKFPIGALQRVGEGIPDIHCFVVLPSRYEQPESQVVVPSGFDYVEPPRPVYDDDSMALDVHGLATIPEIIERYYSKADWMLTSWEQIRHVGWRGPYFGRYTYRRASQVAQFLVDKHLTA